MNMVMRSPAPSALHAGLLDTSPLSLLPLEGAEQLGASWPLRYPAMIGEGTSPKRWMQTVLTPNENALLSVGTVSIVPIAMADVVRNRNAHPIVTNNR